MHYVKHFNINGVDTKQVACIELQGAPNAATEGAVGVLGMDMTSPTHDVYRCVAVNGSVYTWELLSAGMSIISSNISGQGGETNSFPYSTLRIPNNYILKKGDLILDSEGYLYQITFIGSEYCEAIYCSTHIGSDGGRDYSIRVRNGKLELVTENGNIVSKVNYIEADGDTITCDSSTGVASVRGVKTIGDTSLHLFVGTTEEYNALTEEQKTDNLFAILTDDTTKEEMLDRIETVEEGFEYWEAGVDDGSIIVGQARYANSADNAEKAKEAKNVSSLYYHSLTLIFSVFDKSNFTDRGEAYLEINYTSPVVNTYSDKFLQGEVNATFPYKGKYMSVDGNAYDIVSYTYTGESTVSGYKNISLVVRDRSDPSTDITMQGCFNTFTTNATKIQLY